MTTFDPTTVTPAQLAKYIDQSLLKPEWGRADVLAGCDTALEYDTASVCCKPADVELCAEALRGSSVLVGTVIGFPHGGHTTATKVFETQDAIDRGAVEIDMVVNIGKLRDGEHGYVSDEIAAVVAACANEAIVKVILENAYLTDEQKVAGCRAAETAGAAFVKTSTGYAPSGATIADLMLMRATVSPTIEVKAAGGVRDLDTFLAMLNVGVTRFGSTVTGELCADLAGRRRALGLR